MPDLFPQVVDMGFEALDKHLLFCIYQGKGPHINLLKMNLYGARLVLYRRYQEKA
jgi:hypothetical protein